MTVITLLEATSRERKFPDSSDIEQRLELPSKMRGCGEFAIDHFKRRFGFISGNNPHFVVHKRATIHGEIAPLEKDTSTTGERYMRTPKFNIIYSHIAASDYPVCDAFG